MCSRHFFSNVNLNHKVAKTAVYRTLLLPLALIVSTITLRMRPDSAIDHGLSCPIGGCTAISMQHNEVSDLTMGLLREVCHNVTTERPLQHLICEAFIACSTKRGDQPRLDIFVCGFWGGRFGRAFFNLRAFKPSAPSNQQPQISPRHRKHEKEKRRHYEQ